MSTADRQVAVSIHDVEPRSFDRVRSIRDWLGERGVDRATLLVVPAPGGQALDPDRDRLVGWLRRRSDCGDAIAQHGFQHRQTRPARGLRGELARLQGGPAAEFAGLGPEDSARALRTGRAILRNAGLHPHGFVAPAYSHTRALRRELHRSYRWWADLVVLHSRRGSRVSPALCLGASSAAKRVLSPPVVTALGRFPNPLLRVEVHPADFDHPGLLSTLEAVLERADGRRPVTYDELTGN